MKVLGIVNCNYEMINMNKNNNYFIVRNARLSKYLYSLGFDRENFYKEKREYWIFEKSDRLQESLDFFFYMRNRNKQEMVICQKNVH